MLSPAARHRARRREMLLVVALWLAWQEAPAAPTPAADDITRGVVSYPRPPDPLRSHHPPSTRLSARLPPPPPAGVAGPRGAGRAGLRRLAARFPPLPSSLHPLIGAPHPSTLYVVPLIKPGAPNRAHGRVHLPHPAPSAPRSVPTARSPLEAGVASPVHPMHIASPCNRCRLFLHPAQGASAALSVPCAHHAVSLAPWPNFPPAQHPRVMAPAAFTRGRWLLRLRARAGLSQGLSATSSCWRAG